MTSSHCVALRMSRLTLAIGLLFAVGCASSPPGPGGPSPTGGAGGPDPRIGLGAGVFDAEQAIWNMRLVSTTPPSREFVGGVNSDLAFTGNYVIQGSFQGFQIWDVADPAQPALVRGYLCPVSQSDVSVYRNLLFVSAEGFEGRLDCGTQGVPETISRERIRGIRIFDISDMRNPRYIHNVQTCRGSHTHSVLVPPNDSENIYIYVSGSAPVRPPQELSGCSNAPEDDPNTSLFRIEVIRVPLANPQQAAIVSSPRIFTGLVAPPRHGLSPEDRAELERARARGAFIIEMMGEQFVLSDEEVSMLLGMFVQQRGGTGPPTAADSVALRQALPLMAAQMNQQAQGAGGREPGPDQCHDITLYPAIGLAGGACEGYGLLLDISDPVNPRRLDAVADSNFAYWHSATFNNDGTTLIFTDEWGGGGGAKCRASDPAEWGANAIFTIENRRLAFRSYYKLPVPQTANENCVAHNGSLIPIPGRDIKVQAWYQGGISVFDFTDPARPTEIAFFDRGPMYNDRMEMAGSWSVYWYNGLMYSSEIVRGLDILELTPSPFISQNEIDAAKTVRFDYLNVQGQQPFVWPPSFSLARALVDQLERNNGLAAARITAIRAELANAEQASGAARRDALTRLATQLDGEAAGARDAAKVRQLAKAVHDLTQG